LISFISNNIQVRNKVLEIEADGYMSAMSQQLQIGENTVPTPEREPLVDNDLPAASRPFKAVLKLLAALLLAPLLLAIALVGFIVVLADFAWFRLRGVHYGHPAPKGLWEF
jgi:hypothetical protein